MTTTTAQRREALDTERRELLAKAETGTFTAADSERAEQVLKQINRLDSSGRATEQLKAAGVGRTADQAAPDVEDLDGERTARAAGIPLAGKHAAEVSRLTGATAKAFRAADPAIGGVTKALVPSGSITVDYASTPAVEPRPSYFIASALTQVAVDAPSGAFLRQTERTNEAAPVSIGQDKPTSTYGFENAQWKIATLAHLSEPIPRQWLSDFTGLQPALVSELGYGLAVALDDYIFNGGTVEDGTASTGLLNTAGIATTAHATDGLITTRHAIGELEEDGVAPTAIALHPRDWRDLELARETSGKYLLGNAPQERPVRELWGLPVILTSGLPVGTGMVADFRSIALATREGITITWTEQGTYTLAGEETVRDLYATNRVRFRVEGRYGLVVTQPVAIRKIDLTA